MGTNRTNVHLFHSLSLLQAAAGGSEGPEGGAEDESGDGDSGDSGESEGEEDDDEEEEDDEEEKEEEEKEEEEEENEPLSLEWPDTGRKQATYLFLLPIVFPLWLTLPDVRNLVSHTSDSRYLGSRFQGLTSNPGQHHTQRQAAEHEREKCPS